MRRNLIGGLRRPEYTGDNRCLPCTATNVGIAAGLGGGLVGAGVWTGMPGVGLAVALCVVAVSLASIYLRGYLVPGTPALTKRYFPGWLLRRFGKAETVPSAPEAGATDGPEGMLTAAGALEPCADADGHCLTDEFRTEWHRAVDEVGELGREGRRQAVDAEHEDDVELDDWTEVLRVYVDERLVGKWRSSPAFAADLASVAVLSDRFDDWAGLTVAERARLLDRLRAHLDTCPDCGSETDRGTETVEGCCATHEARTVDCPDCDARLYIETCPDCGGLTEYVTETVDYDDRSVEIASRMCTDCEETRVFAVPPSLSPP